MQKSTQVGASMNGEDESACYLKIAIIGAGLGGLATAIALRKKGHQVTVYEATKELMTAGAGIQVPPISTRILHDWNLLEAFKSFVVEPTSWPFRNYATGELLGEIPLNPTCKERYGHPWWVIHRADYQKLFYDAAISIGVEIHLDCPVTSIDLTTPLLYIQQDDSSRAVNADLIIGADGVRSKTRSAILGPDEPPLNPSTTCAYRALIPYSIMTENPALSPLMDPDNPQVTTWLGPTKSVLSYPIRQGASALYNLVLLHPEATNPDTTEPARFPRPASIPEISSHYQSFTPQVRSLVSNLTPEGESAFLLSRVSLTKTPEILEWKLGDFDPLPTWISPTCTAVVVGDAAHASYPYMSAGAAMALEDGVCLAECLDPDAGAGRAFTSKAQLPERLRAFQDIRKRRTDVVQRASSSDAPTWNLLDGPEQRRRDALFGFLNRGWRESTEAMKELEEEGFGTFKFGLGDFMDWLWGYDVLKDTELQLTSILASS